MGATSGISQRHDQEGVGSFGGLLSTLVRFVDGSFVPSFSMMTMSGELPRALLEAFGLVSVPRFPSLLVNSGANFEVDGAESWQPLSKWELIEVSGIFREQTGL